MIYKILTFVQIAALVGLVLVPPVQGSSSTTVVSQDTCHDQASVIAYAKLTYPTMVLFSQSPDKLRGGFPDHSVVIDVTFKNGCAASYTVTKVDPKYGH